MTWRFDPIIIITVAVALAAVVLFGAWWLWWRLPKRQVERLRPFIRDAKARADVEDNYRKTIGQLLGGAAVLIGAGFAPICNSLSNSVLPMTFSSATRSRRGLSF